MSNSVIFDIHIDIAKQDLDKDLGAYDWDTVPRAERTKIEFNKYHDKLKDNKREYAEKVGVDYIHFGRDEQYEKFLAEWQGKYPYLSEYLVINFYKHYLVEQLADKYDRVLYVDFDVYFYTDENIFDAHGDEGIHLAARNRDELGMGWDGSEIYIRSELNKWYIAYAMHAEHWREYNGIVTNTGLIVADSKWVKQLNFMGQLDEMIQLVTHIREGSDFLAPEVIDKMDWNNEPFYSYAAQLSEVPLINNEGEWNLIANYGMTKEDYDHAPKKVVHMILKRFDWIWQ